MSAYIPIILFTVMTNAAAQILLKTGMGGLGPNAFNASEPIGSAIRILFNPWVFLGLATFVVSMVSHLYVLSKVELSYAYPFLSLAYVVVAVYAYFIFKEDVTVSRLAGIGLICLGAILISRSA